VGRRLRERENEIATRHAYEIDCRCDIKVVPSVSEVLPRTNGPKCSRKLPAPHGKLFFTPAARANERGRKREVYRCEDPR